MLLNNITSNTNCNWKYSAWTRSPSCQAGQLNYTLNKMRRRDLKTLIQPKWMLCMCVHYCSVWFVLNSNVYFLGGVHFLLNWSKVTAKTFIILQKIYISNKCCYFELVIHQRILKIKLHHTVHNNIKHHTDIVINIGINNVFWVANQHIRMISEGSRDTKDWSNDAENSALITWIKYILKYILIEKTLYYYRYFIILMFLPYSFSNKFSLGEHKGLIWKMTPKRHQTF